MNYRNKFWRVFAFFSLCLAVSIESVSPKARADAIWDHWKAADAAVTKGNETGAVPHWQFLVNYYDSVGDWESAALFFRASWIPISIKSRTMQMPSNIMSLRTSTG